MSRQSNNKSDLNFITEEKLAKKLNISLRVAKRILAFRPFKNKSQLDQIWGLDLETKQKIIELFDFESDQKAKESTSEIEVEKSGPLIVENLQNLSPELADENANLNPKILDTLPQPEIDNKERLLKNTKQKSKPSWKTIILLLAIFLLGAAFRFYGINWDANFHQHPDERYMSMVAEAIKGVDGVRVYFDTQTSTLNPLNHGSYTYGMLPLFLTRMIASWLQMTHYDKITLVGRALSGLFDLAVILPLFLLAVRLYNKKVGYLAAVLYACAVFPIQLSHFFTVDSFATFFVVLSFYFLLLAIPLDEPGQKVNGSNNVYFILFGFLVGMAAACKVNTLPILGLIFVAAAIYLFLNRKEGNIFTQNKPLFLGLFLAPLIAFIAFRIFQPYAFNGPSFSNFGINPRWLEIIKEVTNQVAGNSEWPPNHHWTNRPVQYAWVNMVLWGMGLPLGVMAWFGWGWAGIKIIKGDWRKHLFPFVWVLAYFLWQNIQFWRYMRYFLPIYPFLVLFAAWALVEMLTRTQSKIKRISELGKNFRLHVHEFTLNWQGYGSSLLLLLVVGGTFLYAFAFTRIYSRPHTRVEASRWILKNIPGPFNIFITNQDETEMYPVSIYNDHNLELGTPQIVDIKIKTGGELSKITAPNISRQQNKFHISFATNESGENSLFETWASMPYRSVDNLNFIEFPEFELVAGQPYYLKINSEGDVQATFSQIIFSKVNEEEPAFVLDINMEENRIDGSDFLVDFQVDENIWVNRLELVNFTQEFQPTAAILKVSILNNRDEENTLVESEQRINFEEPDAHYSAEFTFPEISLDENEDYYLKYELVEGPAVTLNAVPFTLETSWDDALPLSVDGIDALGGIYNPLNLELYELDNLEKRESMIRILDESEFLVIPSNRAYDAMPRLELRYPLTLRYYQLLFDCDCSSNALENRAYHLSPPYTSPLGFDLVAVFVSNPNIGAIQLNDQSADESFTVYDHPKVFIFKKSANFSIEKVRDELERVDLDAVQFQVPKDYLKSKVTLLLPEDRLTAQKLGGTWSQFFNRNSLLNRDQTWGVLIWYLSGFLLGLIVFPLLFIVFSMLPDKGYTLIRMGGLLLLAWLPWIFGSIKFIQFSRLSIVTGLILLIVVNGFIFIKKKQTIIEFFKNNWQYVLFVESLFLILFLFFLSVRFNNPDLWHPWLGGEKPMDFAFFNAVLKSVYFPPENPWFSGHYINYYYYGAVVAAMPTKLLGIVPAIAFNLIIPTWFAMLGIGVFGVVTNIYVVFSKMDLSPKSAENELGQVPSSNFFTKFNIFLPGIIAVVLILFMGNFYQIKMLWEELPKASILNPEIKNISHFDTVLSGASEVISGNAELPGSPGDWYFSASRPILHDGPDTPIVEFPYFSFLYADLHPHLLTMPFFALGFSWVLGVYLAPIHKRKWKAQILALLLFGIFVGSFLASHTWDFPLFLGLALIAIAWKIIKDEQSGWKEKIIRISIYPLATGGVAILFYYPFFYWFKTEYSSIEIWKGAKTPLPDYFIVVGFSLFVMISLLLIHLLPDFKYWYVSRFKNNKRQLYYILIGFLVAMAFLWGFHYQVLAFGFPFLFAWVYLIFFKKHLSEYERLLIFLFAVGYSLTFLTEVVVLKGDVGRSNMVFRIYIQAWFLLGIATSLTIVELVKKIKPWKPIAKLSWIIILQILFIAGLSYPLIATKYKINDRWPDIQKPVKTLDGELFMLGDSLYNPAGQPAYYFDEDRPINLEKDYLAIEYMQEHVLGTPVIVEGYTSEYRWGGRFAVHTGLAAVIGWNWHTRQHYSLLDATIVEKRIDLVNDFYNTADIQTAKNFLNKFAVDYIIVSDLERAYYSNEGLEKFNDMVNQGYLQRYYGNQDGSTAIIYQVSK